MHWGLWHFGRLLSHRPYKCGTVGLVDHKQSICHTRPKINVHSWAIQESWFQVPYFCNEYHSFLVQIKTIYLFASNIFQCSCYRTASDGTTISKAIPNSCWRDLFTKKPVAQYASVIHPPSAGIFRMNLSFSRGKVILPIINCLELPSIVWIKFVTIFIQGHLWLFWQYSNLTIKNVYGPKSEDTIKSCSTCSTTVKLVPKSNIKMSIWAKDQTKVAEIEDPE